MCSDSDKEFDSLCALNFLDSVSSAVTAQEIKKATEADSILKTVIKYMNKGWPRKIKCKSVQPYYNCRSDLQFENGSLLRGHKVVIPLSLRDRMLNELHNTHLGIVKMKCNARSRMWWPGIDHDIERCAGACMACVALRPAPPREPPAPWPRAPHPWHRVHIDYMTIGQKVYLIVVDSYSKWVDCIFMQNGTSTQSLIAKLKYIFSLFGLPKVLVSDNDVKIHCAEFKSFCSNNGIKYMNSPVYHANSNGQAENSVRTCKRMLKYILRENISSMYDIHEKLLNYLFVYRNTVHCTTGETPAKLMFGRELRTRLDLIIPTDSSNTADAEDNSIATAVCTHRRIFQVNEKVWARWYSARKETWELGIIKQKIGNKMFQVYVSKYDSLCIRHVDQLLKYKGKHLDNLIQGENNVK
ncbi:uncharacterized protein K02A2.6-like [Leguminivora glycinivorella]|uniref:uncharacterized protein K02A2.6-like n=1 Tax=Leguminivora glycinivorella TaxID=1035111 RepID=UPI00200DDAC3|nr:uncharacterized protein K02A2.6-like [Leguminivora glycinivorella]